jgi:phage regulator Rha-like protein
MSAISVKGTQKFMGKEIPVVEGGFGEGQKTILAKTVAEIHGTTLTRVNELINNNADEFEHGIDIIDLKGDKNFVIVANDNGLYTQNALNRSSNIYLLSEQGYMALVMLMRTEKAKAIRKQLRREYFAMREKINSDEQLKAQLLLEIYNGGQSGVLASKQLTELETKPLKEKIEKDKPKVDIYERFINSEFTYTATALKGIFNFPSAVAMNKKLHELKLIYKPGHSKKWTAYKDTPKNWYKVLATEFGDTLKWTSEGILGIAKLLDMELSEKDIENLINKDDKQ